ncbi:hypothetical protein [Deinococcus sp. 23YEL01]|uniref:hypothetical protein n=1 Tax=Deinococcus sp. 23YEL01 TaxID=2745871 RepID=UPI001E585000|nr:hypothetical protein [Deinococcus sp. 23YEL01]MCD0169076.1 hypothetical protein [Deinococcus sp. 23YEL01]
MRRLLPLILLTTLTTAHATYCFQHPRTDLTLYPRLNGAPRQIEEQVTVEPAFQTPDFITARTSTYMYQGQQATQITHRLTPDDPSLPRTTLFQANIRPSGALTSLVTTLTGSWRYVMRGNRTGPAPQVTVADLAAEKASPISMTLDAQGRLTQYKGAIMNPEAGLIDEVQVSCTYASAQRTARQVVSVAHRTRSVTVAQFGSAGQLLSLSSTGTTLYGTHSPLLPTAETFTYDNGTLSRSIFSIAGQMITFEYTVTAGQIAGYSVQAGEGDHIVRERHTFTRDTRGNWITHEYRLGKALVATVTRRITY